MYVIFDIETDSLKADKIHVLSYLILDKNLKRVCKITSLKASEISKFLETSKDMYFVGHNIIRFDIPVLHKHFNFEIKLNNVIDTLGLSYYLKPNNKKHNLEYYGKELGIKKVQIKDWKHLSFEDYKKRCERDVEITEQLFISFYKYLMILYNNKPRRLINYINFNLDNMRQQEEAGIIIDKYSVKKSIHELEYIIANKVSVLQEIMPRVPLKTRPKVFIKKDGTLSKKGKDWIEEMKSLGLPENTETVYTYGNPGSQKQLKEWLYSLGWEPEIFEESKATGKLVEKISKPFGGGICNSVKKLYKKKPELANLEDLFKARHRLGLLQSFLDSEENNKIQATAGGLARSLRWQHAKPVVNLPRVKSWYGKEIRGSLIVPDDSYSFIGVDISALEDKTKQHYIYYFDPEYVKELQAPGYDPHMDIAVKAELVTKEEEEFYKQFKERNF